MKKDFLSKKEHRETRNSILLKIVVAVCIWIVVSVFCVAFFSISKEIDHSSPAIQPVSIDKEPDRLHGFYINDGSCKKTSAVSQILHTIESQPLESSQLRDGITYRDFIYYHVTDPEDCYPSAKHPDISVLITVSDRSLLKTDSYWVNYIISMNDVIMDLTFDVSYDLKNILFVDLQIGNRFQYWFEDFSQEQMKQKLIDTVVQFMPSLAVSTNSTPAQNTDTSYQYLFPSDTTYISESDLQGLTKHEVALIRNEIFARHGYSFKTEEFKVYFDTQSWYTPNPNYSDSLLNDIERANIKFIQQYEKKMDSTIRNENFEELVDLGQHPNYDTTIFSSFFSDEYGSYSDFRWEYIGATYSTFTAENGRYDSFDVFKIYFPNDVVGYYLVPFTGQGGTFPIVYRFSEEDGLTLMRMLTF